MNRQKDFGQGEDVAGEEHGAEEPSVTKSTLAETCGLGRMPAWKSFGAATPWRSWAARSEGLSNTAKDGRLIRTESFVRREFYRREERMLDLICRDFELA